MITGIIGKKIGMTQLFDPDGTVWPGTVIQAGPCVVVQAKTTDKDLRKSSIRATAQMDGDQIVYRVEDEGGRSIIRQVPVAFEDVLDNKVAIHLQESGGLRPGDRVVATGVHRLRDGQLIKVVE